MGVVFSGVCCRVTGRVLCFGVCRCVNRSR